MSASFDYRFTEAETRAETRADQIRRENELSAITYAKSISGEMFDLTATSLNNEFGYEHTIGILKYGINFPLSKFINELTKIFNGTKDDKSNKRKIRLIFLEHCVSCRELNFFFELFCNSLNGGGERIDGNWAAQQYYKNIMIITAAGGNIIIVFSQLIANMIDKSTNKKSNWDISDPYYTPITQKELDTKAKPLFGKDYGQLTQADHLNLTEIFELLTPTNKLILTGLQTILQKEKKEIYFNIVKYCIISRPDMLESLYSVAKSLASDFDWKLSANIHPSLLQDSSGKAFFEAIEELSGEQGSVEVEDVDTFIRKLTKTVDSLGSDSSDSNNYPGFAITRAKLVIDNSKYYKPTYTPKQLNSFKYKCPAKFHRLYPQIMEEQFLKEVEEDSDCWKYLSHLKKQKDSIREATQYTIDEITKFHLSGYYKQANPLGEMFPVVKSAPNSTEAIFSYISNSAYNLNIYVQNWEQGKLAGTKRLYKIKSKGEEEDEDEEEIQWDKVKLKHYPGGAPAFLKGGIPSDFTHSRACENFLSLTSILENDSNLIIRLCADILNYFINGPEFNTELILDSLILSFNKKRERLTGKESKCVLPPSALKIISTKERFNPSLQIIKEIIKETLFTEHGIIDGTRLTVNAIVTQKEVSENKDKEEQNIEDKIIKPNPSLASSYDIWPIKSPKNEVSDAGPSEVPPGEFMQPKGKKQKAEGYLKLKKQKTQKKYKQLIKQKTWKKYKQLRKQKLGKNINNLESKKSKKSRQYTSKIT